MLTALQVYISMGRFTDSTIFADGRREYDKIGKYLSIMMSTTWSHLHTELWLSAILKLLYLAKIT